MTTYYTVFVYEPTTGDILRRTMCSDEDGPLLIASLEAQQLGAILTTDPAAGSWDDTTHKVVGGAVVPRLSPS